LKSALLLAPEKMEIREAEVPQLSAEEVMIQPIRETR